MGWTGTARREHSRDGLRYPGDLTEREWALTAPFIPPAKSGGRRRTTDMREVVNALLYVASSGGAWRMLPRCFPPVSTVRRYFYAWRNAGLFETINTLLVMNLREIEGREASPSAGVIDSQSVKTTESGGVWGYDAGKKIRGRKRHILTGTCGFLIFILVRTADIQDRDGAVDVLKAVRFRFPWLRHIFADGGAVYPERLPWQAAEGPETSSGRRSRLTEAGPSKSSNAPTPPKASSSCHAAGWLSEPSHGWAGADDRPKTGSAPSPPRPHGPT